ncbi:beta-lactamase domain-containing protein [Thermoanaerobacter ethanolicus JW 200]|uniref:MBL fold metallo-hydrolase n=1 Tax=Thermoanaerobacter ethanolicus TaxID=1757 RepID=UPI000202B55F|nr:beta-lactamase domain-containing protein [Thermoanaerobacter ethanolicus JW 200]
MVKKLDKKLYEYLLLWQIILEIYIGIPEEAKEHFLELKSELEIDEHNLALFVKSVILLDLVEESLKTKNLFETLMNYTGEDQWIKFYLLLLSFKNKRRILEVLEELLYMEKKVEDKLLLPKIYGLIAEIYEEIGEIKGHQFLDKAYKLNPQDLYILRLKLKYGLISEEEKQNLKLYRLFPEDSKLINEYYHKTRKNFNSIHNFKFFCWGGDNIGASSYLVSYEGINILLDAGALIKDKTLYYNSTKNLPIDIEDIDLVIITHAHLDHSGGIVELLRKGLNSPIIMSRPTKEILKQIFLRGHTKLEVKIEEETTNFDSQIISFDTEEESNFTIKNKEVKLKLFPAGHILGAVAVYLEIEGIKIFYTGDFTLKDVESNKGLRFLPDLKVDILITEATYGYGNNFGVQNKYLQDKLILKSIEKLLKDEERILLPVYAIGKGQDLLLFFRKTFSYIPFNVYVDGDIAYFSKLYENFAGPIYGNGILNAAENTLYTDRKDFIKKEIALGNCVILASSNDLKEGSASFIYASEIKNFSKGCIMNLDTNNREIEGLKNYQIGMLNHANMVDLLETVIKMAPSAVFVIHRGYESKSEINIETILKRIEGIKVFAPKEGEIIELQ